MFAITSFFIAWLANCKLLLFAFDKGPLSSEPSITLGRFVVIACLPIKVQKSLPPNQLGKPRKIQNGKNSSSPQSHIDDQSKGNKIHQKSKEGNILHSNYATKVLLLGILLRAYDFINYIHPNALLLLYCLHIYLLLELILAVVASMARALLGVEIEPQFNDPYLSTSLQIFCGKRWNLMVSSTLRPTAYEPTLNISKHVVGRKWASLPAVLATFGVSALMHELIFYHMGRMPITGEVTCFFTLHGICLAVEIFFNKALTNRWQLPMLISRFMTIVFVISTSVWLFLPQFLRIGVDVRAFVLRWEHFLRIS
ncbi:putative long-chain-alcohol O-fatty-acyltransferase [Rosa chinensis]|uniref:Putative long-chain-alcohol O-fatty-acyltransferase n=1 Tax=Rosa chinensis TaxID=74649 RepID=A0A2P6S873_ROSCH|nr:putative long-chain-alcohol O-fatty-acyltransferase [Rosa chinensis]